MNSVTIDDYPIKVDGESVEWQLTHGLEPYSGSFTMRLKDAEAIHKKQFINTLYFEEDGGATMEFNNLIAGDVEPPQVSYHALSGSVKEWDLFTQIEVLDCRHLLKFASYAQSYNIYEANFLYQKDSEMSRAYRSETLNSGKLWTVSEIIDDILANAFDSKFKINLLYKVLFTSTATIENFSVKGSVFDCLQQVLNHPSAYDITCTVNTDGELIFLKRTAPIDITSKPGVSPFAQTVTGKYGKVQRATKRPVKVIALYPIIRRVLVSVWDTCLPADRRSPYPIGNSSFVSGSKNVTGTGTNYEDEVVRNSWIEAPDGNKYKVDFVTDNTHLTLLTVALDDSAGNAYAVDSNGNTWNEGEFVVAERLLESWGIGVYEVRYQLYGSPALIHLPPLVDKDSSRPMRRLRAQRESIINAHMWRTFMPGGTEKSNVRRMDPNRRINVRAAYFEEDMGGLYFNNATYDYVPWDVKCLDPSKAVIQIQTPSNARVKVWMANPLSSSANLASPLVLRGEMQVFYYQALIPEDIGDYYQLAVTDAQEGLGDTILHVIREKSAIIDYGQSSTIPVNITSLEFDVETLKGQYKFEHQDIFTGDLMFDGVRELGDMGINTPKDAQVFDNVTYRYSDGLMKTRITYYRRKPRYKFWKNARELQRITDQFRWEGGFPFV